MIYIYIPYIDPTGGGKTIIQTSVSRLRFDDVGRSRTKDASEGKQSHGGEGVGAASNQPVRVREIN